MNQYIKRHSSKTPRLTCVLGLVLFLGSQAYADVLGRLHFVVRNAADEKPLADVKIVLKDSANVKGAITLKTDKDGNVTTDQIDARVWKVTTEAEAYQLDTRDITVVADTTTDVEILLEPLTEKVIRITGDKNLVKTSDTSNSAARNSDFYKKYPATAGNPQSLSKFLRTNPGLAEDSNGQVHPRGEHSATSIYINGFRLPGAFQGRAGQVITPSSIETLDLFTGGFAPEYGGETAAVLNLSLKAGTIDPFRRFSTQGGSYRTFDGGFTMGGQAGQAIGETGAKRFGYLLDVNGRRTDNALEPPQPDDQTAHNRGESFSGFGNFDYRLNPKDSLGLILSTSPAKTQVANRTGLPDRFAPFGQGFGYQGALSRADAQLLGIVSQDEAGQDINQKDSNSFGILSWRHTINDKLTSFLSLGLVHSGLDITNNNPAVDLNNLPADSSIEFNPTITRNAHSFQIQGSLTQSQGQHTFKFGFSLDEQNGNESFTLEPASQAAANDLNNIDPRLSPIAGVASTLNVSRKGFYRAAYVQDTWRATDRFTANYGLRLDMYRQDSDSTVNGGGAQSDRVDKSQLSPRINLAYQLAPQTVVRAAYNKLFIQPPQAQGSILGSQIKPETLDQFDLSIEKQIAPGQTLKLAGYYKDIRNQIDTGLLIPGTQIGVFTSVNLDRGSVRGYELSYELQPRGGIGWSGYLSWANALARPGGFDNTGGQVERYNDHDQLNTISAGVNHTWATGYSAGVNLVYGSGMASGVLEDGGKRSPKTEVNLRLSSRPDLIGGRMGIDFSVENLFDSRSLINFNSPFSGTRFQQGRRILLGINGKF